MGRFLAVGTLFLVGVVLGDACNYECLPREQCLEEEPVFRLHSYGCQEPEVCCSVRRQTTSMSSLCPNDLTKGGAENQPCGLSNPNKPLQRYLSKDLATPGEFPWLVALFKKGEFLAGGSLIAPGIVLTAAHGVCYQLKEDLVVRADEWYLNSNRDDDQIEEREVKKIVCHERFIYRTGEYNLALVFLKSPFQLRNHIRTICLPTPKTSFEGHRCFVAGWGKKDFVNSETSGILKKLSLPMVNRTTCNQQLQKTKLGWNYQLPKTLICAGGELNQDACIGDGGSPLFCSVNNRNQDVYVQVGIVNWGIGCGMENVPATYTNLAMFREWIDEKMIDITYKK